jgi:transcription termination factor Rho
MSVLDRSALEASPLADLHAIASELGLDGFRRLRKAELIDLILERQGGEDGAPEAGTDGEAVDQARPEERPTRRGRRRGGRGGRGRAREAEKDEAAEEEELEEPAEEAEEEEPSVEGTVELLGNGSGFVRVSPPEPSDDDVYISAAQVRRCELVSGDVVAGPVRRPRRSERYPSLVRVDTINDRPADEVAEGTRYDDLPSSFPTERFDLPGEDPTLQAIAWLTPIGRGSRVVIAGAARAGKTEALRRLAQALGADSSLNVSLVLVGTRPEEVGWWQSGSVEVGAVAGPAASGDLQAQTVEHAVEQAKRIAARGSDAVVLLDTLDGLPPATARRTLAAARNIVDGGSLTVIATASRPIGGETTVITLDAGLAGARRFPAIDLAASGTTHPELLVGEQGVEAIARARAEAMGS